MSELISNCGAAPREQCAGVHFLSGVCAACGKGFTPWRRDQVTCGADRCRKGRFKVAIRKAARVWNDARRRERRRAKSTVDLLSQTRGSNSRDRYKEATRTIVIDRTDGKQSFSRCLQCGTHWVDENGESKPSSFQFCGETLELSGSCKKAWIEAHPLKMVLPEKKPVVRDFLDEERLADSKRIHAPTKVKMSRRKLNFCPLCCEYVNQDHEHEVKQAA